MLWFYCIFFAIQGPQANTVAGFCLPCEALNTRSDSFMAKNDPKPLRNFLSSDLTVYVRHLGGEGKSKHAPLAVFIPDKILVHFPSNIHDIF